MRAHEARRSRKGGRKGGGRKASKQTGREGERVSEAGQRLSDRYRETKGGSQLDRQRRGRQTKTKTESKIETRWQVNRHRKFLCADSCAGWYNCKQLTAPMTAHLLLESVAPNLLEADSC